jgi:hypothetical protein
MEALYAPTENTEESRGPVVFPLKNRKSEKRGKALLLPSPEYTNLRFSGNQNRSTNLSGGFQSVSFHAMKKRTSASLVWALHFY